MSHTIISREMSALCLAWLLLTLNLLNTRWWWWQGTGAEHMNTAVKNHPNWHRDHYFQASVAKCFSAVRWWDIYRISSQHGFKPSSHTWSIMSWVNTRSSVSAEIVNPVASDSHNKFTFKTWQKEETREAAFFKIPGTAHGCRHIIQRQFVCTKEANSIDLTILPEKVDSVF